MDLIYKAEERKEKLIELKIKKFSVWKRRVDDF